MARAGNLKIELLRRMGRLEEALEQCWAAVALDPGEASYQQHLAVVLFDLDRDAEALDHAGELQDPAVQAAYRDQLGDLLRSHDRTAEALEQYQAAVALAPGEPGYHLDVADALIDLDRVDEAMGHAARGVDLLPDAPAKARAHDWLGGRLRGHDRTAEALEQYQAAVALDPGEAGYRLKLAVVRSS
jgi:tetratricopeptide (TPR) repeat protein